VPPWEASSDLPSVWREGEIVLVRRELRRSALCQRDRWQNLTPPDSPTESDSAAALGRPIAGDPPPVRAQAQCPPRAQPLPTAGPFFVGGWGVSVEESPKSRRARPNLVVRVNKRYMGSGGIAGQFRVVDWKGSTVWRSPVSGERLERRSGSATQGRSDAFIEWESNSHCAKAA
jgi:hypothetical protein